MSRWFRWYEGTAEDGKFRVVARMSRVTVRDVIALWAFILEDAAHLDHRGVCKRNEDFMASILDFEDGTVERILEAMESVSMISVGHGDITICNWNKRQFESDSDPTASRRQREKRERDKQPSHAPVTRDTGGSETEADTETEKKESIRTPERPRAKRFEEWWGIYPRRLGSNPKAAAKAVYEKLVADGVDEQILIDGLKAYCRQESKNIGTPYIVQATKFLRQKYWDVASGPEPPVVVSSKVFVPEDHPAWPLWQAIKKTASTDGRDSTGRLCRGWHFDSEYPPSSEAA